MYKLVISDDEGKTTTVPLVRDEITIGRKEGNTIRLTDRNVSRRHAKLQKENGSYMLQDLGSYNGTAINGTRVAGTRPLTLKDKIVIGDYKIEVIEEGAVVAPSQSAPAASTAAESYGAPEQRGGHVPQATVPAIPSAFPTPPTMPVPESLRQLRLVFLAPAGTPAPVAITRLPMLLGRSEVADVSLPFSSISREHARITLLDDKLMIEDLSSSNGITVNGERVKTKVIQANDMITMGVVEFRLAKQGDATSVMAMAPATAATEIAKKSNAGMLVGGGVALMVLLGGAGYALKGGAAVNPPAPANSTLVTTPEPTSPVAQAAPTAAPVAAPTPEPLQPTQVAPTVEPPVQATAQPTTNVEPPSVAPSPTVEPRHVRRTHTPEVNAVAVAAPTTHAPTTPTAAVRTTPPPAVATTTPQPTGAAPNVATCLLNNDYQCVVNGLRSRVSSEIEFNQLVTAYRALHNTSAAEQTMRRYLQRYPDGRYAERYRDTLGQ
ncbi:MAG: FHA domain-containing protein [Deltaproteobacteria bacterium]|nr:FHA domain-containing protein [Deltaproteobacteria bacterium]